MGKGFFQWLFGLKTKEEKRQEEQRQHEEWWKQWKKKWEEEKEERKRREEEVARVHGIYDNVQKRLLDSSDDQLPLWYEEGFDAYPQPNLRRHVSSLLPRDTPERDYQLWPIKKSEVDDKLFCLVCLAVVEKEFPEDIMQKREQWCWYGGGDQYQPDRCYLLFPADEKPDVYEDEINRQPYVLAEYVETGNCVGEGGFIPDFDPPWLGLFYTIRKDGEDKACDYDMHISQKCNAVPFLPNTIIKLRKSIVALRDALKHREEPVLKAWHERLGTALHIIDVQGHELHLLHQAGLYDIQQLVNAIPADDSALQAAAGEMVHHLRRFAMWTINILIKWHNWRKRKNKNVPYNGIYGAICGDIIGLPYEFRGTRTKKYDFYMDCKNFSDDTILTIAIADWLMGERTVERLRKKLLDYALRFKDKNVWGRDFQAWFESGGTLDCKGVASNGAASRVTPIGYVSDDADEVLRLAEMSARITHDNDEAVRGAQAVALAVMRVRTGKTKDEIRQELEERFHYNLHRTVEEIQPDYQSEIPCDKCVPDSIACWLQGSSFEDVVRKAVSLGGDASTMAAIAGGIAGADPHQCIYNLIANKCYLWDLPSDFIDVMEKFHGATM